MKPVNKKRSVRLLIVGLAAVMALALSGVAVAVSGPSTINTCTKVSKSGSLGKTKVTTSACKAGQIAQTWTVAPTDSDPIVAGHHDATVTISGPTPIGVPLAIPAGSYVVTAGLDLGNTNPAALQASCTLAGPTVANDAHLLITVPTGGDVHGTLQIVDTFVGGDTVSLSCNGSGLGLASANARITATAGTSLTNGAF